MVKLEKKVKKFKGKKKVSNVLEKKAKGLKLNKIDRKKVVKMEEKLAQKKALHESVRAEMELIRDSNDFDEDTRDSICSESSFGSQPTKRELKKRVSFAGNLERTKVFDKNVKDLDIKPSEASPGKGILRAKKAKAAKAKKDLKKKKPAVEKKAVVQEPEEAAPANGEDEAEKEAPMKIKKKIRVTKDVKEQLLNMPRKERKAFLRELKAQKNPLSDKIMEAKLLWEKIRSSKTSQMEKDDCISKLVAIVKGRASKFIYAHDTCRVIECLIALHRPGLTSMLFNELTPEIVRMTKSIYARFFVMRMLKYGTPQERDTICNAFLGHCVSLMRIVHAAEVLELVYNDYANQKQRFDIVSEFYGKEFVLFRSDRPRSLEEICQAEPSKKKLILNYMEENLQVLMEKTTVRHSLTHRLLLDYLTCCDKEQFANFIDSLKDKLPDILHTPDGSIVAMKCIWFASAKDRKLMVKNFKDLSVKAAQEHYGHRVLMAIFDAVDDTVLVNKYITSELGNEIGTLIRDSWGEKVIHYIVHPRDGRGMTKQEIFLMQEGDINPYSKKPTADRYAELFAGIQENLYAFLSANMEELIYDLTRAKFVVACLETTSQYDLFDRKVPSEMRQACNKAISNIAAREFVPMDSERYHIIEHGTGSFLINMLLKCDADLPVEDRLSTMFVEELSEEQIGSWISCNKGCHILFNMIKTGSPDVREKIQEAVNMRKLKEYTFRGAVLLSEELSK